MSRALERIEATNREVAELEERIELLRAEQCALLPFVLMECESLADRHRALANLYWQTPIAVSQIAAAFGFDLHGVIEIVRGAATGPCPQCGAPMKLKSRSHRQDTRARHPHLTAVCAACLQRHHAEVEERTRAYSSRVEREYRRAEELRTMPYAEYLRTPEWQTRRQDALRRARAACQVCNARDRPLHVHHRTYERRGRELASDLTVLCGDCHEHHHFGEREEAREGTA